MLSIIVLSAAWFQSVPGTARLIGRAEKRRVIRACRYNMKHASNDWSNPPATCRPLQIIHGFDKFLEKDKPISASLRTGLADLKRHGLGGVVCT